MKKLLIIYVIAIGLSACEKGPGEGGTSVIEGEVWKTYTDDDTTYYLEPFVGKDVFIIYSINSNYFFNLIHPK